ncbi:BlaI/MecI/CopY family transcriptional regulator [Mycolicibacterium neoaurum]|uniref:BlaI/MecI/CopY family transcriptional regulator n=1 Tax=Mycolicibacterium neoaurum TaxID=1795 RepID=UPI0026723DC2|nr:BlaI/MecI/CopY family transcriptional regulator [Mycolicibacterium neoaurum]MDO3400276.1 BlaI/MecI/CopY family transcriptional regulator [Mycolicibacterium neoaurum]
MKTMRQLGTLERSVMDQLWRADEPLTVRQVHGELSAQRSLAYTTVMTVLRRLADKGFARQFRRSIEHSWTRGARMATPNYPGTPARPLCGGELPTGVL